MQSIVINYFVEIDLMNSKLTPHKQTAIVVSEVRRCQRPRRA